MRIRIMRNILFLCEGVLTQKLLPALQNLLNSRYQKLGSQKGLELGESALMQAMKNLEVLHSV